MKKYFRNTWIALLGAVMFCVTSCKEDKEEDLRSNACEIESFTTGGQIWTISGTDITKTFPSGTDITALAPTVSVSEGATVSPASGTAQDFSVPEGVIYTVTAADGITKKTYTAKVVAASDACDITAFTVNGEAWNINATTNIITKTLPEGAEVTALVPTITLSEGARVSPASGVAQDFSSADGVVYTVTAANGTTKKTYTAKAAVTVSSGTTGDCSWTLAGEADNYTLTISGNGAMGDNEWRYFFGWVEGEEEPTDYSALKTIIVEDGVTAISDWVLSGFPYLSSITIPNSVTSLGSGFLYRCDGITSFTIPDGVESLGYGVLGWVPSLTALTIPSSVREIGEASFADCFSLAEVICLSPTPPALTGGGGQFRFGAEEEPNPNKPSCILKVPAESVEAYQKSPWGELEKFKEIVAITSGGLSSACNITWFGVSGVRWTVNGTNIYHEYAADNTSLSPDIEVSEGASVSPASGVAQNFFTDAGVAYTVTAADGSTKKTYTAKATVKQTGTTGVLTDRTGWTAEARNGNHVWDDIGNCGPKPEDCNGGTAGGEAFRVLDGNEWTGWHSLPAAALPQCIAIDMQASKRVSSLVLHHRPDAPGNDWIYFNTIRVYLSDDPYDPNAADLGAYGSGIFTYTWDAEAPATINLPTPVEGRYLMLIFPDSRVESYISFTELDVYVAE